MFTRLLSILLPLQLVLLAFSPALGLHAHGGTDKIHVHHEPVVAESCSPERSSEPVHEHGSDDDSLPLSVFDALFSKEKSRLLVGYSLLKPVFISVQLSCGPAGLEYVSALLVRPPGPEPFLFFGIPLRSHSISTRAPPVLF